MSALRMAKATEADLQSTSSVFELLESIISHGYFPLSEQDEFDEDESQFDQGRREDLIKLYDMLEARFRSGGMARVLMAAHALLNPKNELLDPALDYLEHHPRLVQTKAIEKQRDSLLDALQTFMDLDPNFTATSDQHNDELIAEGAASAPLAIAIKKARAAIAEATGGAA